VEEVKHWATGACAVTLAMSLNAPAEGGAVKAVYCWQEAKGDWSLHRFKPLINPQGGTVFAEMSFEGSALGEVRLRRFYPNSEVVFDYKFDPAGKLNGLKGTVSVFGEWTAEANLFPSEDGTVPLYRVSYSRGNSHVQKPENAIDYVGHLDLVPIYRTIQNVPCAAMMKEAERMNASRE
jgi:hypothetical protein